MIPSSRIVRKNVPKRIRKSTLREDALDSLIADFLSRCAYCLSHTIFLGGQEAMKIDHHHPTTKGGSVTNYDNLFLSCDRCNQHKWDWWPSPTDQKSGIRYLNCCREHDYDEQIYEEENGYLTGVTPAAKYHILMLKLNRGDLVQSRVRRRKLLQKLRQYRSAEFETPVEEIESLLSDIEELNELLDSMIPMISAPPKSG